MLRVGSRVSSLPFGKRMKANKGRESLFVLLPFCSWEKAEDEHWENRWCSLEVCRIHHNRRRTRSTCDCARVDRKRPKSKNDKSAHARVTIHSLSLVYGDFGSVVWGDKWWERFVWLDGESYDSCLCPSMNIDNFRRSLRQDWPSAQF